MNDWNGDGFDPGFLAIFDAADLLGADLVDLNGLLEPCDGGEELPAEITPTPLPSGAEFAALVTGLGDHPLPMTALLGHIAALSVANPFTADGEADPDVSVQA